MRNALLLFILLFAGNLFAQNYTQNAIPIQQTQAASDCYTRNLDNGNAALLRGETREALRLFNLAKNCPDVQGNSRRLSELESRIARCEELLGGKKSMVEIAQKQDQPASASRKRPYFNERPTARRNYAADRDFLKDTLDDCFLRMVNEADRAFRLRFWEDAAALYRAAKNCNDADQKARQWMSEKITECRNAAENELFAKQQEAERQARHAIAANLADDAQELLHSSDRSLAFRLADFANQYIAPDDNLDCVQAIFDAWYYQASDESKNRENELYRPVFCYELAENLGKDIQVKYVQQNDGKQILWAFVPGVSDLFAWEMPSMKLIQTFNIGEENGYLGFDISPNGDLIFWGNKFFDLVRGARSYRVEVPSVAGWCFNGRGDEFFYQNVQERKIYLLDVREAFAQQNTRKGQKNTNVNPRPVQREIVSQIPDGLMDMKYVNGKFWLGFVDRMEVLSKAEPGKPWKREQTIHFELPNLPNTAEQKDLRLTLYPEDQLAVLNYGFMAWTMSLQPDSNSQTYTIKGKFLENLFPMAVSASSHKIACQYNGNYLSTGFWIMDIQTGDTLLRQHLPNYISYFGQCGSFSPDAHWVAAVNTSGTIHVWALEDAPTVWTGTLPIRPLGKPIFSPDGNKLFVSNGDSLLIFNTQRLSEPEFWRTGFGTPPYGASNDWAMIQSHPDTAMAIHLNSGRTLRFPLTSLNGNAFLYDFDSEGNYVAYQSEWNNIEVRSLKTGALVSARIFEGGAIDELHFVPGTNKLLVLQQITLGAAEIGQSSVKIWSPLQPNVKPQALRLHEYPVHHMAMEESGLKTAFSNGFDIRIFELTNVENELLKIRAANDEYVQAIAFRPNSGLLAAAYASGKVIFWNLETGQAALQLQAISKNDLMGGLEEIANIGFSQDGNRLHIALTNGRVWTYALDPSFIREAAQDEDRQLMAFGEEQIVRYNLEAALYYPGNFERLAESGDAPLVRAFFRYFESQAKESNNIDRVRDYCERSLYLYEHLDQKTKEYWLTDMRFMYEDYAWKLLLRNKINESDAIFRFLKTEFNHVPILLNAHIALLRREFAQASSLYTRYLLTDNDQLNSPWEARAYFEDLEKQMAQLRDYELIDSAQTNCFCGTVALSGAFTTFCPEGSNYPTTYRSFIDQLHWEIFQNRDASMNALRFSNKVKLLEDALKKANSLVKLNAKDGQKWLETVSLELARTQFNFGGFEQKSPEALLHYEKATQLLLDLGPFKELSDTSRYALLSGIYLAWGRQLLDAGNTRAAIQQLHLGLETARPLTMAVYGTDTSLLRIYYGNLICPLFVRLGSAYLEEGYPVEAREAFDQANTYYQTFGGLNTLFQGAVSVYENNFEQAFIEYGEIYDASLTAEALFQLKLLADRFPDKRTQIESYIPKLKEALAVKNPRLVGLEADYLFSKKKIDYFAAQAKWDSAVVWSRLALQYAKKGMDMSKVPDNWTNNWLDEHIEIPYYLLLGSWNKPEALEECIQLVENAEAFLEKKDSSNFYYLNREVLKTNLAHALILRNKPGDRQKAMELYKKFIETNADPRGFDNIDLLEKDIRDLRRMGAPWPDLPPLDGGGIDD